MMDEVDKIGHDFRGDPVGRPARGARSRAEQHLRRPLPRDPVRPVERHVHRHGERGRPHPAAAARPHGDPRDPGLHAAREARHRAPAPLPKQIDEHGITKEQLEITDARRRDHHRQLHARGGRPHARAADRRASSAASPSRSPRAISTPRKIDDEDQLREFLGRRKVHERGRRAHGGAGRRDRPRVDERGRRDPLHRGDADVRHGQAPAHRAARRRHEGVARRPR